MSSLLIASEQFPTVAPARRVTISYVSTMRNSTTRVFTITYAVTATGMNGEQATVYLMPAEAEPAPDKYISLQLATQIITLADGCYDFTLNVPEAKVPNALRTPPSEFYLLIVNGGRVSATPQTFNFLAPKPSECDCGVALGAKFGTDRYNGKYGPVYKNKRTGNKVKDKNKVFHAVDNWDGWAQVVKAGPLTTADIDNGFITAEEKDIIIAVAINESYGYFDSIQGYDNQPLTVGAMQKTVRPDDQGEFSQQLYEFKLSHPALFKCLVGDCGWDVTYVVIKGVKIYPTSWTDPKSHIRYTKSTTPSIAEKIRDGYTEATYKGTKRFYHPMLSPFIRLTQNPDFKKKQIDDFIIRLRAGLSAIVTSSEIPATQRLRADEYFLSPVGRTLVVDTTVNRKNSFIREIGKAVTKLFQQNPTIPKDPRQWGTRHEEYENILIGIFGPTRNTTDPDERYQKILSYYDK